MSDNPLAAFRGAGLPSRETMGQMLQSAAMVAPIAGGKQFIKISDRDGEWTYGSEETVIEEGSLWAINPLSFFHGYIAWHEGKPEGEHRQSISNPTLPSLDNLPKVNAQNGWQKQFGFDLVCINGEDEGTLCEYKASSVGGSRAWGELIAAMNARYLVDPDTILPIVRLKNRKYYDKKYKKDQFPPHFEIVEWRALDDADPAAAPKEEPKATRQRAAAPKDEPEVIDQVEGDDEEAALAAEYAAEQAKKAEGEGAPRRRLRR